MSFLGQFAGALGTNLQKQQEDERKLAEKREERQYQEGLLNTRYEREDDRYKKEDARYDSEKDTEATRYKNEKDTEATRYTDKQKIEAEQAKANTFKEKRLMAIAQNSNAIQNENLSINKKKLTLAEEKHKSETIEGKDGYYYKNQKNEDGTPKRVMGRRDATAEDELKNIENDGNNSKSFVREQIKNKSGALNAYQDISLGMKKESNKLASESKLHSRYTTNYNIANDKVESFLKSSDGIIPTKGKVGYEDYKKLIDEKDEAEARLKNIDNPEAAELASLHKQYPQFKGSAYTASEIKAYLARKQAK